MISVDWFNLTMSSDRQEIIDYLTKRLGEALGVEFENGGGAHGYEKSKRAQGVLIAFGGYFQRGTLLLSLSGAASSALQWYGLGALARALIRRFDVRLKCTRADLALDVPGDRWRLVNTPDKVYPRILDGRVQSVGIYATYKRASAPILNQEDKPWEADGFTLYVGSRTSERMLRIYRKEIKGGRYTRFEYELKERYAAEVLRLMLSGGRFVEAVTMAFQGHFDLRGLTDGSILIEGYSYALPKRKTKKSFLWLMAISAHLSDFVDNNPALWQEIMVNGREKLGLPPYGNTGVQFESKELEKLYNAQWNYETTGSPVPLIGWDMDLYTPANFTG